MTAGRIDHVTRFLLADKSVQPSRAAPDAPPRFVGRDLRCDTQVFAKLLVGRSTAGCRAEGRTDAGTSGEAQLGEQRAQQSDALAVRQAELFIENRQQGMHFRPELTGRSASGRRGPPRRGPQAHPRMGRPRDGGVAPVAPVRRSVLARRQVEGGLERRRPRREGNISCPKH